jgi:hypothetical protein
MTWIARRWGISERTAWLLAGTLAAGLIARVVLAFATFGLSSDINNLALLRDTLARDPLGVYQHLSAIATFHGASVSAWPYGSGFFPFVAAAGAVDGILPFHGLVQLPAIFADLALGVVVLDILRLRKATDQSLIAAAALMAFSPALLLVSGYHGQIDSVGFLPAVLALRLWLGHDPELGVPRSTILKIGALMGVAALVKPTPALVLIPLLVAAPGLRARVTMAGAAAGVFVVGMLPWLLHDPGAVRATLGYQSFPGSGGITMLLQPDLMKAWTGGTILTVDFNAPTTFVFEHASELNALTLLLVTAGLVRWRPDPVLGSVFIIAVVYAFGTGFLVQYFAWATPLLLAAGMIRVAAGLAVFAAAAMPLYYYPSPLTHRAALLLGVMTLFWLACVATAVVLARGMSAAREGPRSVSRRPTHLDRAA